MFKRTKLLKSEAGNEIGTEWCKNNVWSEKNMTVSRTGGTILLAKLLPNLETFHLDELVTGLSLWPHCEHRTGCRQT